MKLRILAIAIVAATASMPAQAELSFGGMARATYNAGDNETLTTKLELNLDASKEANGITYFGHAQLEGTGADTVSNGNNASTDDIYVGMKGGFGEVRVGDTDNGCDATDVGGYSDHISDVNQGGCASGDQNNITYIGSAGSIGYAASYGPNTGNDQFSVGVKGTFGPATVSLGHTSSDDFDNVTVLGLAGSFGPVGLGLRVTDVEDNDDAQIVASAGYSSGANTFAIGVGDNGDANPVSAYWIRNLGGNTNLSIDITDQDSATSDTHAAVRLQHNF